jgi:hypothetical protein
MGGQAIKTAYTRRYSRKEYDEIVPEIIQKAKKLFSHATDTKFFFEKESFGDADILCLVDKPINIDIANWIFSEFKSKEVNKNSHVYSFEYKELQVDFILTPLRNWETSKVYFSYNDLHNLIGKVAHKFGLKWGFDGLQYVYRLNDKKLGTIEVTKDHKDALEFLGFDSKRYEEGFKNLDEIFEFVINSKYFNPWLFDLEKLNRINRERDKKRTTYKKFLEYLEPIKKETKIEDYHYFYSDKKVYLGLIDNVFPGFLRKYRLLEKKEERINMISKKFNGHMLIDKFNLRGKELGTLITNFKESFETKEQYEEFILNNEIEVILDKCGECL